MARKRAVLRLLVELQLAGLYSAHSVLLGIVKQLAAAADFQRDPEGAQAALSLLTALAKAGREELLGMPPALPVALAPDSLPSGEAGGSGPEVQAAEAFRAAVGRYEAALAGRHSLPPEVQATLRSAVERCFEGACGALTAAHAALQATEAENARILNSRGDLPEDMAAAYEAQRKGFEGLQRAAAGLAEVLDRPLPELKQAVTRMAAAAEEPSAEAEQHTQQVRRPGDAHAASARSLCNAAEASSLSTLRPKHPAQHCPVLMPCLPAPPPWPSRCLRTRRRGPFTSPWWTCGRWCQRCCWGRRPRTTLVQAARQQQRDQMAAAAAAAPPQQQQQDSRKGLRAQQAARAASRRARAMKTFWR